MLENGYRFVDALDHAQVNDLCDLYQHEWWSRGRDLEETRRVVLNSDIVAGIVSIRDQRLVAFARVLTDRVFKALIFDVIVAAEHRGRDLGRALIQRLLDNPTIRGVKHVELYCRPELVGFYEQWGFTRDLPEVVFMRRHTEPASITHSLD